jgi:poly(glycerol-phosphate) alpha-glucosyltransferase
MRPAMSLTPEHLRYFMVMWSLPKSFGGMTSMCLRRARNFSVRQGRPAPVLCFQMIPDVTDLTRHLTESGHVVPGMEIRNVFAHYRSADLDADRGGKVAVRPPVGLQPPEGPGLSTEVQTDEDGRPFARITRSSDGRIVYRECVRGDGRPYLLDRTELRHNGRPGPRDIWLLDTAGEAVRHFTSATTFYTHWLDELTDGEPSALIFDDKVAARLLRTYSAPHVVKLEVVHSNHVASGGDAMRGRLDPNREVLFTHQQQWDGLVFLTESAKADYEARFAATGNHFVVPNPATPPETSEGGSRDPLRGAMVAQLRPAKNVPAAVRAIAKARTRVPGIHLDVYGQGEASGQVEKEIARLGVSDAVTLHGFVPGAAENLSTASFSLLTSRYEGMGLVLLESMARGCPPIAFDLRYGPRDVITDGVDGFVVPQGDVDAMAERIVQLCSDPGLVERLGAAGRERTLSFSDDAVTDQWEEVVGRAWRRRAERLAPSLDDPEVRTTSLDVHPDGSVDLAGSLSWTENKPFTAHDHMSVRIQALPRVSGAPVDVEAAVVDRRPEAVDFVATAAPGVFSPGASQPLDLFCIAVAGDAVLRRPVGFPRTGQARVVPAPSNAEGLSLVRSFAVPFEVGAEPLGARFGRVRRRFGRGG